ncbi:MAG: prolyl oligopeptidase family serine peptidase [Chitinophagaceae bacterium]
MKKLVLFFLLSLPVFGAAQVPYPPTKKGDVIDKHYGGNKISVADPYRWLEDDNSEETKAWVQAENKVTFDYLATIPVREKVRKRLEDLWNYPKYSSPQKKGAYYYFFKNNGLQNQSVMYRQLGLAGKAEEFLNPNTLNKEGIAALGSTRFSKTGKYFSFTVAIAGSDWQEGYIMETATGKILKDTIRWTKFGGFSWKGDEGFYYSRYEAPDEKSKMTKQNQHQLVSYHKIGTDQSADELIYTDMEHPFRYSSASLTEDGRFLILRVSEGTSGASLWFIDTKNTGQMRFEEVITGFDTEPNVIDNKGDYLIIRTNDGAPNYKVVMIKPLSPQQREEILEERVEKIKKKGLDKVDLAKEIKEAEEEEEKNYRKGWKTIIPEKDMALQGVSTCGGYLFASYLKDASTRVYQYTYEGKLVREIKLPGIGTASGFSGEKQDLELFYNFSSFNVPPSIYRYNIATGQSLLFRKTEVKIKTDDFVTKQVFFTSKDGTKVPMFLTYKKGMIQNGQNPTLIYGYGGFNIPVTPGFNISNAFFIEQGGIYAVVNLRGGSEYGEKWHKAGMLEKKQNVFDDFIGATEYLIKEKYTNSQKTAIRGGSNGGLLVGAAMTQRPELFKVALPAVGVMDMLRFHKFTVGWGWAVEYGNADSASQFPYLYKYSPYHNLKPGVSYPATLVTTGDHDDRVVPAHSFKFAARLQEYHSGTNPVLIRVETNAGHGAGKPTSKQIDEATDIWSFVMYNLGMPFKEPAGQPIEKKGF